jgi:hypothetical protein
MSTQEPEDLWLFGYGYLSIHTTQLTNAVADLRLQLADMETATTLR